MTRVLISIGSNQNDPKSQIYSAFNELEHKFEDVTLSDLYLTEPVGTDSQTPFINASIVLDTSLNASSLLHYLMEMEQRAGRVRNIEIQNGPRNLDLDIILFGEEVWSESQITIPHPRYSQRRFVLEPAATIAGDMIDPSSHKQISQLLDECTDQNWVKILTEEVEVV
jgi:2-amino-4-hydroxy-6-hydroxymethyldihydropteridine diphosphokinase